MKFEVLLSKALVDHSRILDETLTKKLVVCFPRWSPKTEMPKEACKGYDFQVHISSAGITVLEIEKIKQIVTDAFVESGLGTGLSGVLSVGIGGVVEEMFIKNPE